MPQKPVIGIPVATVPVHSIEGIPELPKINKSVFGVVALVLSIFSLFAPYIAGLILVPAAVVCAIVAINHDKLIMGSIALLLSIGAAFQLYATSTRINNLAGSLGGISSSPSDSKKILVSEYEYNKVKQGMSYEGVRSVLGLDGKRLSRSDISGMKIETWIWSNPDGSNITISFIDGKVSSSAMLNLKRF